MRSRRPSEIAPGSQAIVGAGEGKADAGDGVAFGEPVKKFFANAGLLGFKAVGIVLFPLLKFGGEMNGGGTFAGVADEFVDGGDDALGVELPIDEESIGGQAAMQWAGGDTVKIGKELPGDGSETIEIEMGVASFERVEGPLHVTYAAMEGFFALEKLQETADAAVAMRGEDTGHVGVDVGDFVAEPDEAEGEADHGISIEGAEDLATGCGGDDEGDIRLGLEIGFAPDFALDIDATVKFFEFVTFTNDDVGGHVSYGCLWSWCWRRV